MKALAFGILAVSTLTLPLMAQEADHSDADALRAKLNSRADDEAHAENEIVASNHGVMALRCLLIRHFLQKGHSEEWCRETIKALDAELDRLSADPATAPLPALEIEIARAALPTEPSIAERRLVHATGHPAFASIPSEDRAAALLMLANALVAQGKGAAAGEAAGRALAIAEAMPHSDSSKRLIEKAQTIKTASADAAGAGAPGDPAGGAPGGAGSGAAGGAQVQLNVLRLTFEKAAGNNPPKAWYESGIALANALRNDHQSDEAIKVLLALSASKPPPALPRATVPDLACVDGRGRARVALIQALKEAGRREELALWEHRVFDGEMESLRSAADLRARANAVAESGRRDMADRLYSSLIEQAAGSGQWEEVKSLVGLAAANLEAAGRADEAADCRRWLERASTPQWQPVKPPEQ